MSADELPPSVRARLTKIHALATSGIDGEKENAQRMLEAICKEHGVNPESLVADEKKRFRWAIQSNRELAMFKQCAFHVLGLAEIRYWKSFKAIQMEMTTAQAIDLRACFKHYKDLYRAEEETFYDAFVQRHRIFGPSDPDAECPPIDPDKLEQLLRMMRSMKDGTWKRPAARLTQ